MTTGAARTNLLGMSQDMLEEYFAARGEKPYRARQVMQWIYQRYVTDFDDMTDLSKKLREPLRVDTVHASTIRSAASSFRKRRRSFGHASSHVTRRKTGP